MSAASPLRIALFGQPVGHSRSAELFRAAAEQGGPLVSYEPLEVDVDGLGEAVHRVRSGELDGANVTIPHKLRAAKLCDRLEPAAAAIGAVNVLRRSMDGAVIGENTDGEGFVRSLARCVGKLEGRVGLVLGSGGAARAVASALASARVTVTLVGRDRRRTEESARCSRARRAIDWAPGPLSEAVTEASLVVQATPVGMSGVRSELPFPAELLDVRHVVADLVYRPWETAFLARARAAGARAVNGWPMLVEQAALALELWGGADCGDSIRRAARVGEPRDPWSASGG